MSLVVAVVLVAHGVAHLIGFVVPWRLMTLPEMPYKTTLFAGRLDARRAVLAGEGGQRRTEQQPSHRHRSPRPTGESPVGSTDTRATSAVLSRIAGTRRRFARVGSPAVARNKMFRIGLVNGFKGRD